MMSTLDRAELSPVAETRGSRLRQRRLNNGLSVNQLHEQAHVSRDAIYAAEDDRATDLTYSKLEKWLDNFEHETGSEAPTTVTETQIGPGIVSFEVSGNFGVDVALRGPVENLDALRETVEKLIQSMGDRRPPPET